MDAVAGGGVGSGSTAGSGLETGVKGVNNGSEDGGVGVASGVDGAVRGVSGVSGAGSEVPVSHGGFRGPSSSSSAESP